MFLAYVVAALIMGLGLLVGSGCRTGQSETEISTPAMPKPEHTVKVQINGAYAWNDCTIPQEVKSNVWVFTNFSYADPSTITVVRPTTIITITE